MNEIHELGLMYLNYEILSNGYQSIYLGESVPTDSLIDLKRYFNNIVYVCYMTVEPNQEEVNDYIIEVKEKVLDDSSELWILGRMAQNIDKKVLNEKTIVLESIQELTNKL